MVVINGEGKLKDFENDVVYIKEIIFFGVKKNMNKL